MEHAIYALASIGAVAVLLGIYWAAAWAFEEARLHLALAEHRRYWRKHDIGAGVTVAVKRRRGLSPIIED